MATKTKRRPPADEQDTGRDDGDNEEHDDDQGDDDDQQGSSDDARIRAIVTEVLAEVLGEEDNGASDDQGTAPAARSTRSDESRMEDVVRKAMDRLRSEEEHESRLKAVEEKVREEAPRTYKRLTKVMWGADR